MTDKTIYIVGAGASSEARMPTGVQLKEDISRLLDYGSSTSSSVSGDIAMRQFFTETSPGTEYASGGPYQEAAMMKHALGLARSIDNLLDAHRDRRSAVLIGKAAICRAILSAEAKSLLQLKPNSTRFARKGIENTWYTYFLQSLVEGCSFQQLADRLTKVEIVTFNYDRTLEQFLLYALSTYYDSPIDSVIELVKSIKIHHPYGTVGSLPFQKEDVPVAFGANVSGKDLARISDSIVTFSLPSKTSGSIGWKEASRIVFLGFAFHPINMSWLFPDLAYRPDHFFDRQIEILGTTLDSSQSDRNHIEDLLRRLFGGSKRIELYNGTCTEFFGAYRRSLGYQ